MIRYKIYDAAGPTPSFTGRIGKVTLDSVSSTHLVETATFRNGPFEGDTWRQEWIGDFDFSREWAKVDAIRIVIGGERHYQFDFDRPLDLISFETNYALAADMGTEFIGNRYANRYKSSSGDDELMGGAGDDRLKGEAGDDVLRGGQGADRLHDKLGNDTLMGGGGDDRLQDDEGNDLLRGGAGADHLMGGPGEDRLVGGPGDDRLVVGPGGDVQVDGDVLTGGGGADVFVFKSPQDYEGRHRVTDFQPGRDVIDLSKFEVGYFPIEKMSFRFIGEERFSGEEGELRFDGDRLVGNIYGYDDLPYLIIQLPGVETLRQEDLLL